MYRYMWIFVEGENDRRFIDAVLLPILTKKYDFVDTWEYAQEPPKKVIDFLRAMKSVKADCLFLADVNSSPCATAKKDILVEKYVKALEPSDVMVVVKEIESWYLAGLDDGHAQELRLSPVRHTDGLTKERFREIVPHRFNGSVVDFMSEILRGFRSDIAKTKNRSFCYLMDKLEARPEEA